MTCGGNCANVMVGLSRLDVVARPLMKMGSDAWGSLIMRQLTDEAIDMQCVVVKDGHVILCARPSELDYA